MIETQIIRSFSDLKHIEDEWLALWKAYGATPFQHPMFGLLWWEAFRPGSIETTAFFKDGNLVALLPCYREDDSDRLLLIGMGLGDYLDALCSDDPVIQTALFNAIEGAKPPISLEDLPPSSCLARRAEPHRVCPSNSTDKPLPSRMRRSVALSQNRISRRGNWRGARSIAPLQQEQLTQFAALHIQRQNELGHSSLFDDPRATIFIIALACCADFPMRLHEASIDGAVAASIITLTQDDRLYFWLSAFASAFAYESPGKVLISHILEEARSEGFQHVFWLRGDEAYKSAWGAEPTWSYRLQIPRPDLQAGR